MKHLIKWMDYSLIKKRGGEYLTNQILYNIKSYIAEEKPHFSDNIECEDILNKISNLINDEISVLTNFEDLDLYET